MAKAILNNHLERGFITAADINIPYEIFNNNSSIGVILCPGDPLKSGNMNDYIIKSLFVALDEQKYSVMRFTYIKTQIYKDDYHKYIRQTSYCVDEFLEVTGVKYLIFAGFSMGAMTALNVALRRPAETICMILLSPALLHYDMWSWVIPFTRSVLILYGENDPYSNTSLISTYTKYLETKNMSVSTYQVSNCGYHLNDLSIEIVIKFIADLLSNLSLDKIDELKPIIPDLDLEEILAN